MAYPNITLEYRENENQSKEEPIVNNSIIVYWLNEGVGQRLNVLSVQIGGRFIQGQNTTVQTEGLC